MKNEKKMRTEELPIPKSSKTPQTPRNPEKKSVKTNSKAGKSKSSKSKGQPEKEKQITDYIGKMFIITITTPKVYIRLKKKFNL